MKFALKALIACVATLSFGYSSFAQSCLSRASNSELLDEIRFRLSSSGGGSSGGLGAEASFSCSWSGELRTSIVSTEGREQVKTVNLQNASRCQDLSNLLNRTRSNISKTSIVAICSWTGDMTKFSLTAEGKIVDLSPVFFGNYSACIEEETKLNSRP